MATGRVLLNGLGRKEIGIENKAANTKPITRPNNAATRVGPEILERYVRSQLIGYKEI